MKRLKLFSLALTVGLTWLQPHPLFAQEQDPNNKGKKGAEKARHEGKGAAKLARQDRKSDWQGVVAQSTKKTGHFEASAPAAERHSSRFANQSGDVVAQSVERTSRHQSPRSQDQTSAISVQGTRSNHYGGRWMEASHHGDWDRNADHEWDHHHYRWYDGGWLIVDAGPSYFGGGSIGSSVQEKLSEQGYYDGPIDGDIGPGTRRSLARYQSDYGLRVNGRIDDPTLASLGLE